MRDKSKFAKAKGNKRLQVSKKIIDKRSKYLENITSPKGILLAMNRSIQVEGVLRVLKQDYAFNRFLTRAVKNIEIEFILLCSG